MKTKTIRRDLERLCERVQSSLVIAEFHVLNTETIQCGSKRGMNRKRSLELLDRLVSMTGFNRFERLVVKIDSFFRRIVSRHHAPRDRLSHSRSQVDLHTVD